MYQSQDNRSRKSDDIKLSELVERLKQSKVSTSQFLTDLLAVQCTLGQAQAGAILQVYSKKNNVDVLAIYPHQNGKVSSPDWLRKSSNFAREALLSDNVISKTLDEIYDESYDRPVRQHILMVPLTIADIGRIVMALLVTTDSEVLLELTLQRLQLSAGILNCSQMRVSQQNWQQRCKRLQQAMETLSAVNRHERFSSAAMAFCNEAASQWQCERASIGFVEGRYIQLKAISHAEGFSRKMKVVEDIESVMEECLDQDIEVLSPAAETSTYISRAADKLSQKYGPLNVLSLPLRRAGDVIAVFTLERPVEETFGADQIETIRLACELCTARLVDLYENDRWLGAIIARKSRNFIAKLVGPKHTWLKVTAILCFCAMIFLIFGKGQFRSEAPFVLEPIYQQVIPAPFDGYIKSVEVEVGDMVEAGTSILGSLDTAELRLELTEAKADRTGYLKQASAAMRDGQTAQEQIANANAERIQAQIELLEYEISHANLISPISGVVVQGELKRKIGAPVKTGDVLFEVCPLESLRAQLMVPEEQIYDIEVGQEGFLATASYPSRRIKFVVERINPIAEVVNQRNVFKVRVQLLQTYSWMRPGMEGVAKVSVGRRRYAWMWSRKIVNWIRMKLWL